jgi:hypothetical protein
MNVASWTDAFLIIQRWEDNHSLISFSRIRMTSNGPEGRGQTGTIFSTDKVKGIVRSSSGEDFDLLGAEFEYDDERDSPILESSFDAEETLLITLSSGEQLCWAMLANF